MTSIDGLQGTGTSSFYLRRLPVAPVVVVVVVVVVGITFIHGHWESPCMVLKEIKRKPPYFYSYFLNFSTYMVLMSMYGQERGGHTPF